MSEQWLNACVGLAKLYWNEYGYGAPSETADMHEGDRTRANTTADEVAALRWLEEQPEFQEAWARAQGLGSWAARMADREGL
jgi:hypothetical protein